MKKASNIWPYYEKIWPNRPCTRFWGSHRSMYFTLRTAAITSVCTAYLKRSRLSFIQKDSMVKEQNGILVSKRSGFKSQQCPLRAVLLLSICKAVSLTLTYKNKDNSTYTYPNLGVGVGTCFCKYQQFKMSMTQARQVFYFIWFNIHCQQKCGKKWTLVGGQIYTTIVENNLAI